MSSSTVFSKSVLKTKKESKLKLLLRFTINIIRKNRGLFFVCALLAVITAIINFNIGVCFKNTFFVDEKTLSTQTIEAIKEDKGNTIDIDRVKRIIKKKANKNEASQKEFKKKFLKELKKKTSQTSFKKEEAIELIEEASKDTFTTNILRKYDFKFKFNLFG